MIRPVGGGPQVFGSYSWTGVTFRRIGSTNPGVPHVPSPVANESQHDDPNGCLVFGTIRQLLPDTGGLVTEDGKVDTITSLIGSKRKENTYPHFTRVTDLLQILVKHPLTHVIPFDPCTLP